MKKKEKKTPQAVISREQPLDTDLTALTQLWDQPQNSISAHPTILHSEGNPKIRTAGGLVSPNQVKKYIGYIAQPKLSFLGSNRWGSGVNGFSRRAAARGDASDSGNCFYDKWSTFPVGPLSEKGERSWIRRSRTVWEITEVKFLGLCWWI